MLCKFHHGEYDQHRIEINQLTDFSADGPMEFKRKGIGLFTEIYRNPKRERE